MDTVAQVVSEWLPPTESFVYVQVAGVKRFRSVVLTRRRRDTPFDFEPVVELTRTVPIAIDLSDLPYEPRRRSRPLVVMQASRLVEKKGVDLTLSAFAQARQDLGESELWIVGDGPERGNLEARAASLGLDGAVRFLGARDPGETRQLMQAAHIGIHPSRTASDGDREGTPVTILEMLASGMPVVATRHADIPSIVPRPEELVVEEDDRALADALRHVATVEEHEWLERAAAGRKLVEERHEVSS